MVGPLDERHPRPKNVSACLLELLVNRFDTLEWAGQRAGATYVTGVAQSSQRVRPGDIYVALPGTRFHGADFVEQAAGAGAVAILTDPLGAQRVGKSALPVLVTADPRALVGELAAEVYGHPSRKLNVVGITGTNGKTTTSYLLDAALRAGEHATAVIGTVETRIGDQHLSSVFTTPEAADLQALLAVAVERRIDTVVLEVSSFALMWGRVAGVDFTVAAFTNLSPDHLDVHHTMAEYFRAKARLFDGRATRELIVIDDEAGRELAAMRPGALTVSGGAQSAADWRVHRAPDESYLQTFELLGPRGVKTQAEVAMPGAFNVTNAALAIAIANELSVEVSTAAAAIALAPGVPGRMERVSEPGSEVLAVVDYAHAPDGVTKALAALRGVTSGRLICVLGAGGDRDAMKRPTMGQAAAGGADVFVLTDDNPRSEDPGVIRAAVLAGAMALPERDRAEVIEVGRRAAAIEHAVSIARAGDTIAVLGKGHEQGQTVKGVKYPFDDRKVLRAALADA